MPNEAEFLEKLKEAKQKDIEVLLKKSYRGIWETAIKKYSDSAHFVYELLQNADDTKASWVEFIIEEKGLWFKHNGSIRFTISDPANEDRDSDLGTLGHINAITSIGNSTKRIDEQKIGKFGIGFKAVFAYSLTPHIYDDNFNFKLENYIVPTEIEPNNQIRNKGETLFYFPFNLIAKPEKQAYAEIEKKLESLFQPILFLSNIQKIKWVSLKKNGEYSKITLKTKNINKIDASLIEVSNIKNGITKKERLWLFSKYVNLSTLHLLHKIVVAFVILDDSILKTGTQYQAFCFFPTKEETKLNFIIQAPFLLTDSREGIKAGDDWNIDIIQLVAELAGDAIILLKLLSDKEKNNFINDSILELIPYKENDFSEIGDNVKISFKPFYTIILQKFITQQIIPGRDGKYFKKENAYWASDPELAELFSDEQISLLMDNPCSGWVFPSKGQKQINQANKQLESYINSIIKENLYPKKLLTRITSVFIEQQTDEWLLKFYAYLGGRKSLWDDKDKLAIKRPILLNQNRKAIIPFDQDLITPNIFLPNDRMTSYDTIFAPFTKDIQAMDFFKGLGLSTPDLKAEIYKSIIPLYNGKINFNDNLLLLHFEAFFSYYEICPISFQTEYLDLLRTIPFLASISTNNPEQRFFCKPSQVYFNDEKLMSYFKNSPEIRLLDNDFYVEYIHSNKKVRFLNFMQVLGLFAKPKMLNVKFDVTAPIKKHFLLDLYEISLTHAYNQIITDRNLEGLYEAIKNIKLDQSTIIWEYLLEHFQGHNLNTANNNYLGIYKYVPKGRSNPKLEKFDSTFTFILKKENWLFDKYGILKQTSELSSLTLNDAYNLADINANILLEFLGILKPDADLSLNEEQRLALNFGRKLINEGITNDQLNEFINMIADRKLASPTIKNIVLTEISVGNNEIDKIYDDLKNGVKKNRNLAAKKDQNQEELLLTLDIEPVVDQDEFSKPSVDYQKKIAKLKLEAEAAIEDLTRIEKLNEIVDSSEKYSFAWYKALLELEYLSSSESNAQGRPISIHFAKVEKESGTERTLILKQPNRYIPQSIEDIGDLQIRIYQGDVVKSVTVEVVSVKEFTLRAKLKKSIDIIEINLDNVTRVVIDVKNPVFILEELRKAFYQLSLEDAFNLQQNLTEKIRFIFGPPGTGKTTFLASNEIIPLMQNVANYKVLVLTPTNKAADVLTNRIIEQMGEDETYYNWLLRFGTTADAVLESSSLVVDKNFDIRTKPRNTTITTIARFPYDYFQPDAHDERLHLKFLQWDYIIIDEASMINLANISYILYQRKDSNFIIAGDPFQIQPITQIEQWKDQNIYTMVELDKFKDPVTVPHKFEIVNLQKQYRSIPTIGNIFSHFTYNGILTHHRSASEQKPLEINNLKFKDINVIKFPVSKFESIYKPNTLNKSNYQVYSALFTVEFINNLSKQIIKTHKDKFRIGVICPYKAQAILIEKLLTQQHIDNDKTQIQVGTIHGFQGDECDIIVAIFNPPFSISKSSNMFLNKQNILNVSISRARDYLFLIIPDDETQDIDNLYKIKQIEKLIHEHAVNRVSIYDAEEIEEKMFGSKSFIYDNSFATTHQSVNVYSKPERKYEVRCEEIAIDIQIKH